MAKSVRDIGAHKRINLLVLIVSMPMGGVETQILSVIRRLDNTKYNPMICCIRDLGSLGEDAIQEGINIMHLGLMKSSRFNPLISLHIARVLREFRADILWTHQYVANLYGRMAVLLSKTPVVVSNYHALYDKPKLHRRIFNHLFSHVTDAHVAVSGTVASDINRYDRINADVITTIHNGIDLSAFDVSTSKTDCRKRLGLPIDKIIVGTVGRLSMEKNHQALIRAVKMLPEKVVGLIIGNGNLREDLKRAANGRFIFIDHLDHNDIPVALKAMDIFCFPSFWEGFALAAVEAMAAGLPIVASDIPTHVEVIGDPGMLFPVNDVEKLRRLLEVLMENTSLRTDLGRKSKARAGCFSIDDTARKYDELFQRLLKKKELA